MNDSFLCGGETIYAASLDDMLTAGPEQAKLAKRYKDMGLKKTHISWGPEAKNMSAEERATYMIKVLDQIAEEEANTVPIKVSDLREIYKTLKQLSKMCRQDVREIDWDSPVTALKSKICSLVDFPATFAGQALPKEIRKQVKKEIDDE